MNWSDIASTISKIAPAVGTMIGGPVGAIVGQGLSMALGVENKPDAVAEALKSDPEALVKIKQYEIDHKYDLQKLQLKSAQQELDDVKDARNRQNEHEKATGESDINLYVLAWTIVIGFFGLIGVMMFVSIPEASNNIIYMLFGTLGAGFGSVMQYFFGSSRGSKQKTLMLGRKINNKIPPAEEVKT